jgi:ABC-2 type transport system permease protein
MTPVRLMIRRHRWMITGWSILLIGLAGATVSAYQATYPTPEQRRLATELAQRDTASLMLYGRLAEPGSPALMFAWEVGAIATILAALGSVILAIALTRAAEDDGSVELIRSAGIGPRVPLRSAIVVLVATATVFTLGCTTAIGLAATHVDAVTWSGALAFGGVVGLTFLLFAGLTVVLAQIAATTGDARLLGFSTVAVAFGIRAVADTQHLEWLNWLSPLALRSTVRPFQDNRWWVLLLYLLAAAILAVLATVLGARREFGAGLLRRRDRHDARLNVRSSLALAARLARRPTVTWTVAVASIGTLFSAMGSGVVQQSRQGDVGGFLGSQLGAGDPVAGYFGYSGTVVGMVVCAFAVLSVLRVRQDEVAGRSDHLLVTGIRRWEPLSAQLAVTAGACAVVLLVTGLLSAAVAPTVITGTEVSWRAFGYTVGQWPAAAAAAGWTALLIGRWPRLAWLSWTPLLAGGTLALLGGLLGVPHWIQELGIFQHVPDPAAAGPDLRGLIVLLTVAAGAGVLGVVASTRRDVVTG